MSASTPMVDFKVCGVQIKFPFEPYASQKAMICQAVQAFTKQQNALLESPTGSGKTMALLCSALGFLEHETARLRKEFEDNKLKHQQAQILADKQKQEKVDPPVVDLTHDSLETYLHGDSPPSIVRTLSPQNKKQDQTEASSKAAEQKTFCPPPERPKPPKIFYASRTHKQIAQLISELRRTAYVDVSMTILSSRQQTCINPTLRDVNKREGCRELLTNNMGNNSGCNYHREYKRNEGRPDIFRQKVAAAVANPKDAFDRQKGANDNKGVEYVPFDIEDLVRAGKRHSFCPYYVGTKALIQDSQLIFCPYNYLIDPLIRKSMKIDTAGAVLIFDEAHNIEDACREAASQTLKCSEFAIAAQSMDSLSFVARSKLPPHFNEFGALIRKVFTWLKNVSAPLAFDKDPLKWKGPEAIEALADVLPITPANVEQWTEMATEFLGDPDPSDENDGENGHADHEEKPKIGSEVKVVIEKLMLALTLLFAGDGLKNSSHYHVVVQKRPLPPQYNSQHMQNNRPGVMRSLPPPLDHDANLHFWCMNPAVIFEELSHQARSVVLASGTLAPINTFESELGKKFMYKLEAPHVIDQSQVLVAGVGSGPTGLSLKAVRATISTPEFQTEFGRLVLDVCERVSHGVLLFVPSYSTLANLRTFWESSASGYIWKRISRVKHIEVEPSQSDELTLCMRSFYDAVRHPRRYGQQCTGALLIAVCRGKISEGIDFADEFARAVITMGIPYPYLGDLQVQLKREYNDHRKQKGDDILSGVMWYETQAFRALNQALGRATRHKQDWAALIIVDDRFVSQRQRYVTGLSKWIQKFFGCFRDYGDFSRRLSAFCARQQPVPSASVTMDAQSADAVASECASPASINSAGDLFHDERSIPMECSTANSMDVSDMDASTSTAAKIEPTDTPNSGKKRRRQTTFKTPLLAQQTLSMNMEVTPASPIASSTPVTGSSKARGSAKVTLGLSYDEKHGIIKCKRCCTLILNSLPSCTSDVTLPACLAPPTGKYTLATCEIDAVKGGLAQSRAQWNVHSEDGVLFVALVCMKCSLEPERSSRAICGYRIRVFPPDDPMNPCSNTQWMTLNNHVVVLLPP